MAKRAKKSTQGASQPKAKTAAKETAKAEPTAASTTMSVQLRTERMIETEDAKGRRTVAPFPWSHTVHYNGKVYAAGDVFECDMATAERLIDAGTCIPAGTKDKPFTPPYLKRKENVLTSGVVKRADVQGKIPVYEPEKGNKGEWEDEQDLDL